MSRQRRTILLTLFILAGLIWCARAESPLRAFEAMEEILSGQWVELDLDLGAREFAFTPADEADYVLCAFPIDDFAEVRAELYMGAQLLASGDGTLALAGAHLRADEAVTLRVSGTGKTAFEISRAVKSRCCELPLTLRDAAAYTKQVVHPGDDHWFQISAETGGAAMISCTSEEGIELDLKLMDARGRVLMQGAALPSGAQVVWRRFEAGRTYLLRMSAPGGGTGRVRVEALRSANTTEAKAIEVADTRVVVTGRSTQDLGVSFEPADACPLLFLDSSDDTVIHTGEKADIEGREEGTAIVTAIAYGGARVSCHVVVERVNVQRIRFPWDQVTMAEGEQLAVSASLEPYNATERSIRYDSADPDIVKVDESGVLTALRPGTAQIFATSLDRGLIARLSVTVQPARRRYRALLVGEQNYMIDVDTAREGSVRSIEGVMSLLRTASFGGTEVSVTALMDAPRDSVIAALRRVFGEARADDVSILYITCHGFYRAGMTQFVMADGSVLSAMDLAGELADIRGTVVVLADCCASGGLIGAESSPTDLTEGIAGAFTGLRGAAPLAGSGIHVIASACLDQDSYRMGDDSDMATVFGLALCESAGWDLDEGEKAVMRADADGDGKLTLDETTVYLKKSVPRLLREAGSAYIQTVCAYPEHDTFVWYARDR